MCKRYTLRLETSYFKTVVADSLDEAMNNVEDPSIDEIEKWGLDWVVDEGNGADVEDDDGQEYHVNEYDEKED